MLAAIALIIANVTSAPAEAPQASVKNILVFSKTAGFRHDSIPAARKAMLDLSTERKWSTTFTEDSEWFQPNKLSTFDAVVFLLTTGDVLNSDQERAFEGYIRSGGGYVGIHAAADTEYDWPWYGKLAGAYFASHPAIQEATIRMENADHPTISFLPNPWVRRDEWYDYKSNPRGSVTVLATVDESTYSGAKMGKDHPIMWCHEFDGGRSWYTGLGHTAESYQDPLFMRMIGEAIVWASGKRAASK